MKRYLKVDQMENVQENDEDLGCDENQDLNGEGEENGGVDPTLKYDDQIMRYDSFDSMGLDEVVLKGIYSHGFEKPSAIQQKAIVPFTQGQEIIAQAQSGCGKTGTFAISLLQLVDNDFVGVQGIILAPTRELAHQISNIVQAMGFYKEIKTHTCVGGTDWKRDVEALKKQDVRIVVGTPGRVYDMLMRGAIDGAHVEHLILDEADEMLDAEGFQDIVYDIFGALNPDIHVGLFSATMPQAVINIADQFMKNPVKIVVKSEELTLEGIRQFYVALDNESQKFDVLCDIYNDISINSSVIFCNSKNQVDNLVEKMSENDFAVSGTHGGLDAKERNNIMKEFRDGKTRVLITTDLLARGIDVQTVSVVINYDLSKNIENYIHRIGRSGRFGRKGLAINFVTKRDMHVLKDIERYYDTMIEELPSNISELVSF